ncbi:MAG: DNA alkylation repair protein, partial [Acidimicrobiia bacterium]|nr:DNA alkylation repair protein [Acidimicrobiia bacterium]
EVLGSWQDGSDEVADITRHALRVLIKQGHAGALELLGFHPDPDIVVEQLTVEPSPATIGSKVAVSFTVRSTGATTQPIVVDGVVHFARQTGTSKKVFKWKTAELAPGASVPIRRSVTLQHLSTRRIYAGTHAVEVQVNGAVKAAAQFEVEADG